MGGYIKIDRDLMNNPWVTKDADHMAVMFCLLRDAAYAEHVVLLGGSAITLHPGQLVTGRDRLSKETGVQADKVGRILKCFETAQLIAQQMHSKGRLITLLCGDYCTDVAQQDAQELHSNCTTTAQQLHTTEIKNKGNKGTKELKEKGVSKDTPKKKTQTGMVEESDLPAELKEKTIEWLRYKAEKRQGYKETGLKALLTQIRRYADEYGPDAVAERLDMAMANGWQGANFDKMNVKPRAAPKPVADKEAEEYLAHYLDEMEMAGNANW